MTLPPGPTAPPAVQAVYAMTVGRGRMHRLRARYGDAVTVRLPGVFGLCLVLSNPDEVKQLLTASPDVVDNVDRNLGRVLGPRSLFATSGDEHKKQRKLLVPSFHGRRLDAYEQIIEDETVRELASWPEGREFSTLPSTMRITLNIILRAVFGAEGAEFDRLRTLLPQFVSRGSWLARLPMPTVDLGRFSPWGRFWQMRREYDGIVNRLIDRAERDPNLDERDDVLAMFLQSRYDDGSPMPRSEIADQLLTLLSAGHETTATTLAWTIERLRRHPAVLADLVAEADAGGSELREATILEVQRNRPVIDMVGRQVRAESMPLGRWTLPKGCAVLVSITLLHNDEALFPDARTFNPYRFVGTKPDWFHWLPFGGGARRCIGAAFANLEMNVVLRTLLRDFTLIPTTERAERRRSRGIANAPAKGGRALVRRRTARPEPVAEARSAHATTTS